MFSISVRVSALKITYFAQYKKKARSKICVFRFSDFAIATFAIANFAIATFMIFRYSEKKAKIFAIANSLYEKAKANQSERIENFRARSEANSLRFSL